MLHRARGRCPTFGASTAASTLAVALSCLITATTEARAAPPSFADPPGTTATHVHRVDVIGNDTRAAVPDSLKAVAEGVGLLVQRGGGSVCTAFCVSDNVIATNAHCLVVRQGQLIRNLPSFRFIRAPLDRRLDANRHISRLLIGVDNAPQLSFYAGNLRGNPTEATMNLDWAFAKLRRPICRGHALSFAGENATATRGTAPRPNRYVMIGYHGDRGLEGRWISPDCTLRRDGDNRLFQHTCDSFQGSSGSPILRLDGARAEVVAINVGSIATRRYRIRTDRQSQRRIGRPRLLSTSVINIATGPDSFLAGLDRFQHETPLANIEQFTAFQQELKQSGYYVGAIDGEFGPLTRRAITDLESDLGLPSLGMPTQEIRQELLARQRANAQRGN